MVEHDGDVLHVLRQARPEDLPDELASPHAPAAQAMLEEILSMPITNAPDPVATATEPPPTLPPPTARQRRHPRLRLGLAAAAAAVVAVAVATAALQGDGTSTSTSGRAETAQPLDPAVALPESLVAVSSEPDGLEHCQSGHADMISADQIDGALRLLPTWLPEGFEVDQTWARHESGDCPSADPLLVLRSVSESGRVDATIEVQGPFADPLPRDTGPTWTETTLRGEPALRMTLPDQPEEALVAFTWTEGGVSWWIEGENVTSDALTHVAESLALDSTAAPDEPPATLPDDAIPAGFERVWQASGPPAVESDSRWWHVSLADTARPAAEGCEVSLHTTTLEQPVATSGSAGSTLHVVRGRPAVAVPQGGTMLFWEEAPGVVGAVTCPTDVSTAMRIAESLVPVEPDAPGLRPLGD
jgi:hypothetical protein